MFQDLRHAVRILRTNPAFSAAAVLTMALGIGASIAVFSLVNAVLLRPLGGVRDPGRIVSLARELNTASWGNLDYPDYADYRDSNRVFSGLAAHSPSMVNFSFDGAERIAADLVTDNYFEVLGVRPEAGRLLMAGDEDIAVISDALWQRKFARNPAAIGSRIVLNGYPFVVAGVAAPGFRGTAINDPYDIWVPLKTQPKMMPRLESSIVQDRAAGWIEVFGRRKPGVELRQAQAEMTTLSARLRLSHQETKPVRVDGDFGMYPDDRAEVSSLLGLLGCGVALVLLIACANVAGLLLVRASGRTREMATRLAIGAGRARIVRQLMTEGLLLALLAGAVGWLLAQWSTAAMLSALDRVPLLRAVNVDLDWRVVVFTLLTSVASGMLFALAPVLETWKVDLTGSLKAGSAGAGYRRARLRTALVAAQVALSFVLLTSSAVLLRDLYRILQSSPGYETKNAIIMMADVTGLNYSAERSQSFYRRLIERIESVPGVASASLAATVPPYDLSTRVSIFYPGQEPTQEALHAHEFELGLRVDLDTIAPRYFETLGIRILEGHEFSDQDHGVAIVGRRLAERLWPGQNPIGKRVSWPAWSGPPRAPLEIIGVAADVKYRSLLVEPSFLMYVPRKDNFDGRAKIVVRTVSNPRGVLAEVERAAREVDHDVPIFNAETMADHVASSLWQQRMAANWIAAFSLLAMALAAVGLYSVVAQAVAQRTREVGIRMALGARPEAVTREIAGEGMRIALYGVMAGIPAALGFHKILRGMIEGIGASGIPGFAATSVFLAAILLIACWIPARRAARIDPIEALRCE